MMNFAHFSPFNFLLFLSCFLFSTNFANFANWGHGLLLSCTTIFSNVVSSDDHTTDLESGQKGVKYSAFTPSRCFQVKDNLSVIFWEGHFLCLCRVKGCRNVLTCEDFKLISHPSCILQSFSVLNLTVLCHPLVFPRPFLLVFFWFFPLS